jgi:hypothetical protein
MIEAGGSWDLKMKISIQQSDITNQVRLGIVGFDTRSRNPKHGRCGYSDEMLYILQKFDLEMCSATPRIHTYS